MADPVNSYDSRRDPLSNDYCRATAPGRYGYLATPAVGELPVYGKPRMFNGSPDAATVTVVAVDEKDDTATLTLAVPPGAVVCEQIIVRRMTAADAGVIVHIVA